MKVFAWLIGIGACVAFYSLLFSLARASARADEMMRRASALAEEMRRARAPGTPIDPGGQADPKRMSDVILERWHGLSDEQVFKYLVAAWKAYVHRVGRDRALVKIEAVHRFVSTLPDDESELPS